MPGACPMRAAFRALSRRSVILSLLLAAAGAGIGFTTYAPEYEAVAWVRLPSDYGLRGASLDRAAYLSDQRAIMVSPPIIAQAVAGLDEPALAFLKRQGDPRSWLATRLRADQVDDSNLLTISLRGGDPEVLAPIVNEVKHAYLEYVLADRYKRNDALLSYLAMEKERRSAWVEKERIRVREMARNRRAPAASTVAFTMADFLKEQIAVSERESNAIQAKLDELRKQADGQPDADPAAKARIDELEESMRETLRHRGVLTDKLGRSSIDARIEVVPQVDFELAQAELQRAIAAHAESANRIEREKRRIVAMPLPESLYDAWTPREDVGPGPARRAASFAVAGLLLPLGICVAFSVLALPGRLVRRG